MRSNFRTELRNATRLEDNGFSIMTPFRPVIRGVGGVIEKLIMVFVLGLLGAGFLAFAGENVDAISETARKAPGRAAMVGFAGSFLLIPVWSSLHFCGALEPKAALNMTGHVCK